MTSIRTFLAGCATMSASLVAIYTLTGAKTVSSSMHFDEITVGRINIAEPDGTKRLIISNRSQFPGGLDKGVEHARADRRAYAGMIFLDNEGTENGGLIYNGAENENGEITSALSLTFDRFRQDQTLQLAQEDDSHDSIAGLKINDVPSYKTSSMEDINRFKKEVENMPESERQLYWNRKKEEGRVSNRRIYLGTTYPKDSVLMLNDARGRTRMILRVRADGTPEIQMLDENRNVVKSITPDVIGNVKK